MTKRTIAILVLIAAAAGFTAVGLEGTVRLPGNHQGYAPTQPISFSHRLHAGELKVDCRYCHSGAERSRHAGIPAASVCMNCHTAVKAPWQDVLAESARAKAEEREAEPVVSPELKKLFDAVEGGKPLEWVRVHNLADFVYFDHRPHSTAGVACQTCHGEVQTMDRVRQVSDLSMGWCLDCHRGGETAIAAGLRAVDATSDCAACHY